MTYYAATHIIREKSELSPDGSLESKPQFPWAPVLLEQIIRIRKRNLFDYWTILLPVSAVQTGF
jgi:hypothetical protein